MPSAILFYTEEQRVLPSEFLSFLKRRRSAIQDSRSGRSGRVGVGVEDCRASLAGRKEVNPMTVAVRVRVCQDRMGIGGILSIAWTPQLITARRRYLRQ